MKLFRLTTHIVSILPPLLIVAACASAQTQPQKGKGAAGQQPASDKTNSAPMSVEIKGTVVTKKDTGQDQTDTNREDRRDSRNALFSGLLVAVGVLQVCAIWGQVWVARKQNELARQQNKIGRRQSGIMEAHSTTMTEQLEATTTAANAAQRSADAANDSLALSTLERRAWVVAKVAVQMGVKGDPLIGSCLVHIENCGLTPATNIRLKIDDSPGDGCVEQQRPSALASRDSRVNFALPDLAPRGEYEKPFVVMQVNNQLPFISGVISYQHTGGKHTGETRFCVQFADERQIFLEGENTIR